MKIITCEMCGKQELRHAQTRFCFDCAYKRQIELTCQAARRRDAGLPNVKQCKLCGKEFIAEGNQRYCSAECSAIAAKEWQHDYYLRTTKRRRKENGT